ncbi:Periplasmic binding protein [Corynebacterium heidelbergense]|uniref:ABC transporter iron(III)/siderophore-binding protein n=1 Tax=Corynebacterium heidelbergense TaxID=2055947 RepID=A0A364VBD8_9CORY|nr:ABC transporter iron(III)/siderophore-binding protein [Corynebacterium heidelbergense]WCZ35660.1 Periplasmic binding protein [Corynebacterium heidelbergense]
MSAVALLAAGSVLTGCGDNSENQSAESSSYTVPRPENSAYPLTINNCGREVTFTKAPSRVLILNGASVGEVESLLVLDQDKAIIGNAQNYGVSDDRGMVPRISALPTIPGQSPAGATTAEQVLAAKPDMVISTWAGGFDPGAGAPTRDQLAQQGIASYVNPAQCDSAQPGASAKKKDGSPTGIKDSFDMLMDFGRIFNVQQKAAGYIEGKNKAIESIAAHGQPQGDKHALIAYPGMAAMNTNGLPAVMTGGIYDDILAKAGLENSIEGDAETTKTLNAEKLASAKVDVLVLGQFSPAENPAEEAKKLFAKYPQWEAAKHNRWVSVSDSAYYGPLNHIAVAKISDAAKR